MTREMFIKRWKESEKGTGTPLPLVYDCINAREIVHIAYDLGFIKGNVYRLALESIQRNMNTLNWKGKGNRYHQNP